MADERHLELLLLTLLPFELRPDKMTVGLMLVERGGAFADIRLTRDWNRVVCFAPDLELEVFEYLERDLRYMLQTAPIRSEIAALLAERYGTVFDVEPTKAIVTRDPVAEMKILDEIYLAPLRVEERARRTGHGAMVEKMADAFRTAGVLDLMLRDLDMREFTGDDDPFRVDFGFRVGKSLKMFQALALNVSRDPAVNLAYRSAKIQEGMRLRGEQAIMTAIVAEDALKRRGEIATGLDMLRAQEVAVRGLNEMGQIAEKVRREMTA